MHRLPLPVLVLVLGLSGCSGTWGPGGGGTNGGSGDDDSFGGVDDGDDDTTGDDDATGDDDTGSEVTESYPYEEAFFALALGNTWTYEERVSGDAEVLDDAVDVEIVRRLAGPDMDPPWPTAMVVFEFEVDRALGTDEVHWYGLDGSNRLKWVASRVEGDFEHQDFEGDGSVILRSAASESALVGQDYDGAMLLADIEGHDYEATSSTLGTYFYGTGQETESLENEVSEGGIFVGRQYWKAEWGLLGFDISLGSTSLEWEVTACSVCPPSAGL